LPEGDTVYKVARVLRRELEGECLVGCSIRGVPRSERLIGARVVEIETLGKHTVFHFSSEVQLRVHLGMKGSWHRYSSTESWKRSKSAATVILEKQDTVLVCFGAQDVEVFPTPQRRWIRVLNELGPDLLAQKAPEWDAVSQRVYRLHEPTALLGEVLLDQRVACGIGNVYKSELCFLGPIERDPFTPSDRGYSPWTPISQVPKDVLVGLFQRARELLLANLGGWPRTTRVDRRSQELLRDGNLFVYGRAGERCFRCQSRVKRGIQGLRNRVTDWCPKCQKPE
jgi:endonuclease VIII